MDWEAKAEDIERGIEPVVSVDWEAKVAEVEGSRPRWFYNEQPRRTPTGEISTITGKPIMELTGNEKYSPADFETLMKAGFADSNDAKMKIFAEGRGIGVERYEVKDGKIWFVGDDGIMYPEVDREADILLTKLFAELPSEGLADVGAGLGALAAGPGGAIIGAGAGELLRKQIGAHFFGDKQSSLDYAQDIGLQMLFAGVDAQLAKNIIKRLSTRKIKKATGGRLTDELAGGIGDISDIQRIQGRKIRQKGEKIGVDVMPHQAMDDPALTGYYSMLRDNPKTARQVRAADDRLDTQVERSSQDLLLEIAPHETDPFEVGARLAKAGDEILGRMKKNRSQISKPHYEAAYVSGAKVDTQPVIDEITHLKSTVKPGMKSFNALTRIERMLFKKAKGKDGKEVLMPENSIEVLDNVKQEIDAVLYGKNAKAISPKLKRRLQRVKDQLTSQTDMVSPEYKKAREVFSLASPEILKAEDGIIGALAGMRTDAIKEKAVSKIFASPRSVRVAKRRIEAKDPELWKDTVAEHFRNNFEKAAKVAQGAGGKVLNRPGKYTSRMWDASDQRKLKFATAGMKDANGAPLYDRISDFFEVMQKASIGQGKESATQPRFKMEKDLTGWTGKLKDKAGNLYQSAIDMFLKKSTDYAFDRNSRRLLDLMQTQEGVELIAKAKGYPPGSKQRAQAITTFLFMSTKINAGKVRDVYEAQEKERR